MLSHTPQFYVLGDVSVPAAKFFSPGSTQSLPCHTASGDNCTSSICPNTVVNYTCTITSGTAAGYTDWTLPTGTCPTNFVPDKIRLSQSAIIACPAAVTNTCGPYTASGLPPSDSTNSILTVNITAAMNGSTVTCSNTLQSNLSITTVACCLLGNHQCMVCIHANTSSDLFHCH